MSALLFDREKVKALCEKQTQAALKQLEVLDEREHPSAFVSARIYGKVAEAIQLALCDEFNVESTMLHILHAAAVVTSFMMCTILGSNDLAEEDEMLALDLFVEDFAQAYARMRRSEHMVYLDAERGGSA